MRQDRLKVALSTYNSLVQLLLVTQTLDVFRRVGVNLLQALGELVVQAVMNDTTLPRTCTKAPSPFSFGLRSTSSS